MTPNIEQLRKSLVCLVPKDKLNLAALPSSHEESVCDCEVLKILEALDVMQDALKRIHWGDWSAISGQDYAEQFAEEALNRAKEILG